MLFPYNTDAPIYHLPIVTVGLIVANVAVYAAHASGVIPEEQLNEYWILTYGDGLHPIQWILSNFTHEGLVHLLGNMVFLWAFGLVIEGKLGWWKYLLVYLTIAVGECAVEQTLLLGADPESGGSFGASSAIYGLLAMCLVWAPRNDLSCLLLVQTIPRQVEIPILTFGGLYIGLQFAIMALFDQFSVGSAALHLLGATIGAVLAVVLLKTKVVDCEGWDLFAVLAGREASTVHLSQRLAEKHANEKERRKYVDQQLLNTTGPKGQPKSPVTPSPMAQQASAQIDVYLQQGNAIAAATLYKKLGGVEAGVALDEKQLVAIIQGLLKAQRFADAVPLMVTYLKQYPDKSTKMRLKLAEVLIHHLRRLETARRVLDKIPDTGLPEPLLAAKRALLAAATELEDDADLEVDKNEDW